MSEEDLAAAMEELARGLEDLRTELERSEGRRGVSRLPTPRDLLRFTERYAIPTAVAALEVSARMLELVAAAIRSSDRSRRQGRARDDRVVTAGYEALDRVDRALVDLGTAVERRGSPQPEVRRLLEEVRTLRAEVDDRLTAAGGDTVSRRSSDPGDRRGTVSIPVRDVDEGPTGEPSGVDVEAELESIKDEVDREDEPDDVEPTGADDDADSSDGDDVSDPETR